MSTTVVRTAPGSLYAHLLHQIRATDLLERRPGYYLAKISLTVLAYGAGWVAFVLIGRSWWTLLVAAIMGVLFTQVAFLGHDAGHKQIFRGRRLNHLFGMALGNLGVGLSYGWWIDKHNRHHAHPNEVGRDPDIDPGVLVFVDWQARLRGRAGRSWTRIQAYLFFPLLLLEGLNLHVASVRALSDRTVKPGYRRWEITLFALHLAGYLTAVLVVLTPGQALAFIAVHQGLFGLYMGCSFAPNHKGMPILDADTDYLRRQVLTSRNVRGGRCVDLLLGGLNYQIEHHLFPSMPRPNLRRAQHLIRRFCAEQNISYTETGLIDSYRQVLRHLHDVGAAPGRRTGRA